MVRPANQKTKLSEITLTFLVFYARILLWILIRNVKNSSKLNTQALFLSLLLKDVFAKTRSVEGEELPYWELQEQLLWQALQAD